MSKPIINLESGEVLKAIDVLITRAKKDKVTSDTALCRALATHEFFMKAIDDGAVILLLFPDKDDEDKLREVVFEYKNQTPWKEKANVTKKSKTLLNKIMEFLNLA